MTLARFALAACALAILGCAATGVDRSHKASTDMTEARDEVVRGTAKLDETMAALDAMNAKPDQNLTGSFSAFRGKLETARTASQNIAARADAMKTDGDTYFAEWEKEAAQINNDDIRTLSNNRRKELQDKFKDVSASFISVKEAHAAILSDLNDIEKHLNNDLTPGSVKALAPTGDKLKKLVESARGESSTLVQKIDGLVSAMSPTDVKPK